MSLNKSQVVINLDQSDAGGDILVTGLIQQNNLKKLIAEICRDVGRAKNSKAQGCSMGTGSVYFIDGTRGAGKSTFLQSFFSSLDGRSDFDGVSIAQWAYIDPSRIENSETILLPLLKELNRRVMDSNALRTLQGEKLAAEFRSQFQILAGGLSLFAKGGDQLKDLDPELFLDWGLERAGHGISFRTNLHILIEKACEILRVDVLAVAFDDADTRIDSASEVLETIRKYLDTPRLIVLVTGDLELYSQLTRDGFHQRLGNSSSSDRKRSAQRLKMIDHLEDQYLLKLFPIRKRIHLRPMWNLLKHNDFVLTCADWGGNNRSLLIVLSEILRRGLRLVDARDLDLFQEFLLKQPLRSLLQITSRCAASLSRSDAEGENSLSWSASLASDVADSLRAMALGSLYKYNVDVDAIGAGELSALVEAVFDLTVQGGEFDTTYLRPQSSDAALRNSYATLAAEVAVFCADNPSATLQYLLGGPGSVALYGQVLRTKRRGAQLSEIEEEALRADFKKYVGIGRKEDALHWAWHASVILAAPNAVEAKRPIVDFGVIGLNKKGSSESGLIVTTAIRKCIEAGDLPVFALSLVDASAPGSRLYASIYNVLGLIDRVLRIDVNDKSRLKAEVARELARAFKTPALSRPAWTSADGLDEGGISADDQPVDDDDELSGKEKLCVDELSERVVEWLETTAPLRVRIKPSAVLIGKIWTRLYFSLEKVSEFRRGKVSAAHLMEIFSVCVINAFLVEEFDYRLANDSDELIDRSTRIDRTNPLTSPRVVLNKFRHGQVAPETLPLTFLMASSPLLLGLLSRQGKYDGFTSKLEESGLKAGVLFCTDNSWKKLQASFVAGTKQNLHSSPHSTGQQPSGKAPANSTKPRNHGHQK
jgi:hypothetical protein